MTSLVMLRVLGDNAYEYIGTFAGYVHPDKRHLARLNRVRHLFTKAIRNKDGAIKAVSQSHIHMASTNWAEATRWQNRAIKRERLFTRRMIQHRDMTETLSRNLFERGV